MLISVVMFWVGPNRVLPAHPCPGAAALSECHARRHIAGPTGCDMRTPEHSPHFVYIQDPGPTFQVTVARLSSSSSCGAVEKYACILPFYHTCCRAEGVALTSSLPLPSLARYCMTCLTRARPVTLFFRLTFVAVNTVQREQKSTILSSRLFAISSPGWMLARPAASQLVNLPCTNSILRFVGGHAGGRNVHPQTLPGVAGTDSARLWTLGSTRHPPSVVWAHAVLTSWYSQGG